MSNRRSAASQQRMKIISLLGAEEKIGSKRKKQSKEDTFGMDDDDWNVYRTIVSYCSSHTHTHTLITCTFVDQKWVESTSLCLCTHTLHTVTPAHTHTPSQSKDADESNDERDENELQEINKVLDKHDPSTGG